MFLVKLNGMFNVCNIKINICFIELKWDCKKLKYGKKLKYDMITRWDEYE